MSRRLSIGSGGSRHTRNGAQVFIHSTQIIVRQPSERGPRHHLKQVIRSGRDIRRRFIIIDAGADDLSKVGKTQPGWFTQRIRGEVAAYYTSREYAAAGHVAVGVNHPGIAGERIVAVCGTRVAIVTLGDNVDQIAAHADERAILAVEIEMNRRREKASLDLAFGIVISLLSERVEQRSHTHNYNHAHCYCEMSSGIPSRETNLHLNLL